MSKKINTFSNVFTEFVFWFTLISAVFLAVINEFILSGIFLCASWLITNNLRLHQILDIIKDK